MTKNQYPIRLDVILIPYFVIFFVLNPVLMLFFGIQLVFKIYAIVTTSFFVFQSRLWKKYAKEGLVNLIPTLFVLVACLFYGILLLALSWITTKIFKKFVYQISTIVFSTIIYLFGMRLVIRTTLPKDRIKDKNKIILLNHSAWTDNLIISCFMGEIKWAIIVKEKMMKIPPFSHYLLDGRGIPMKTDVNGKPTIRSSVAALNDAGERLKNKFFLVLFPEGTRFNDSKKVLGKFGEGAVKLAFEYNVSIVGVIFVWPKLFCPTKERPYFCTGTIDVFEIGEFEPDDYITQAQMNEDIRKKMEHNLIIKIAEAGLI